MIRQVIRFSIEWTSNKRERLNKFDNKEIRLSSFKQVLKNCVTFWGIYLNISLKIFHVSSYFLYLNCNMTLEQELLFYLDVYFYSKSKDMLLQFFKIGSNIWHFTYFFINIYIIIVRIFCHICFLYSPQMHNDTRFVHEFVLTSILINNYSY